MERLVAKDYESLRGREGLPSLDPEYIREAIEDYGETIVMPPDETFKSLYLNDFDVPGLTSWWSSIEIWTAESGHSDLTMEFEITLLHLDNTKIYFVCINDIHVM